MARAGSYRRFLDRGRTTAFYTIGIVVVIACYNLITPFLIIQGPESQEASIIPDGIIRRTESPCDESNVYPMSDNCNCRTTSVLDGWGGPCCSRTLRHAHKMGNHLARKSLSGEMLSNLRVATDTFRYTKPDHDYRDVVIIRDLFSTIVSGYLYHKRGHECWLDAFGGPSNVSTIDTRWWETIRTAMPFPIRKKRSLCQYLVDETEENGLHLYTHMSLHFWFRHIAAQYAYSQSVDDGNRTMFLCFDRLESNDTRGDSVQRMVAHLWPGGHNFRSSSSLSNGNYAGGHSTKDVARDYKTGLRDTAARLDLQFYAGEIASINSMFDCGTA